MLSLKAVHYSFVKCKGISGHFTHDGDIPACDPFPPTPMIPIFFLQTTSRKQSVQDTEISPISKLFLWFCVFAHVGGFCIFLYNANLKMRDTGVKGFCYHLLFLKFFCLGGNSYMLNKSLFERHSLLRTFKCSRKRGKWSSYVLMSSWKTWKEPSLSDGLCPSSWKFSPVSCHP